jgi:hypothetical protein
MSCPTNEITLNKPFTARLGEQWCLEQEDLRSNLDHLKTADAISPVLIAWAGRYVMAVSADL